MSAVGIYTYNVKEHLERAAFVQEPCFNIFRICFLLIFLKFDWNIYLSS